MTDKQNGVAGGVIYAGSGWLGYIGPAPALRPHMHPAIGLYIGLDGPIRLSDGQSGAAVYAPAEAKVPGIDVGGKRLAAFFLSANNPYYLGAWSRFGDSLAIETFPNLNYVVELLCSAYRERPAGSSVVSALIELLGCRRQMPTNSRVREALAKLDAQCSGALSLPAMAEFVHLSPRRFQTIFQEATGLRFRRFRLWQRLLLAADLVPKYSTLTELAVLSGFSDLPHLSRSFRDLFGISPAHGMRWALPMSYRRVQIQE
ncbi:hypothetical protein CAI21_10505 [Alkalilimnicola ehrlichii]|uniref:HTH araC/xylS-type domain-containing protein n=1 Tax=Alkalilimnicola ehrlichii TaxID=351052 RepID=A0A3E0WSZ6_9GAMM|nr:AraC family transcriptional regulator [Alkalilimnicola ehrlichii]RFA29191.1 hypothetical protein CAI21_10505 [Alkalilimnicola ehrlichii]RFA36102.1 hypothetical protein CAL65_11645 [Alkalilimnicola ehrlichii]